MVFFFISYLIIIIIIVLPVNISLDGYFDNRSKRIQFAMKLPLFYKLLETKQKQTDDNTVKKKKTLKKIPIHLNNIPRTIIEEIKVSITIPPEQAEWGILFSLFGVFNAILPLKIIYYNGNKTYMELFVKLSFSLMDIIPILFTKTIKKGD